MDSSVEYYKRDGDELAFVPEPVTEKTISQAYRCLRSPSPRIYNAIRYDHIARAKHVASRAIETYIRFNEPTPINGQIAVNSFGYAVSMPCSTPTELSSASSVD